MPPVSIMKFSSDITGMLVQDSVIIYFLCSLFATTMIVSFAFKTGAVHKVFTMLTSHVGRSISWDLLDPRLSGDKVYAVYNVSAPSKPFNGVLKVQRYIRREFKSMLYEAEVNVGLQEFSEIFLRVNSNVYSLDDGYFFNSQTVKQSFLTVKEVGMLYSLCADFDNVKVLASKGLNFNQIVECLDMPVEWVLKMYSVETSLPRSRF